jgi:hypothetical protein
LAPETAVVYAPGGRVRSKAESALPEGKVKAPTALITAAVAGRIPAATLEVPAVGAEPHPWIWAMSWGPFALLLGFVS